VFVKWLRIEKQPKRVDYDQRFEIKFACVGQQSLKKSPAQRLIVWFLNFFPENFIAKKRVSSPYSRRL
jgi:hypothetical protein